MKKVFFKAMLPVVAFVLASAGAVSTSDLNAESSVEMDGWRRTSPVNCTFVKKCNNVGNILCTSSGIQLYAKPSPSSYCSDTLYHQP